MINKTYNINDVKNKDLNKIIQSFENLRENFIKNHIPFHIDGESEFQDKYFPRFWEYASVIHYSNLQKGMKVLDAGSAYSLLSPFLADNDYQVWSNDVTPYWKERKSQMKYLKKQFTLDIYDLTKTRYPDNFFDRIFCVSVIEHIPEDKIKDVLIELNRILKKNGILAITFDYYKEYIPYGKGQFKGAQYCQYFNFESIKQLISENTGFILVQDTYCDDTDWNNPPLFNQYNFGRVFLKKIETKISKYPNNVKPLRVGHISFDFYYGGIQEQIQILTEHSKNNDIEHMVIACNGGPLHEWADNNAILHAIISKWDIASFCESYQIDVVVTHIVNGTEPYDHIHAYEIFVKGIPIINLHYCSYKANYPFWLFDHIITNAHSTIQFLPKGARYSIIPLAINNARLDIKKTKKEIKEKWNIKDNCIVIGRLSRLEPTKLADQTIIAMAKIKTSCNYPLIFFIGGAEAIYDNKDWYITYLKELTHKENIPEIIFTGPIYGEKKAEFLHLIDINLAPTSFEGYGLIFVEPAYCFVPTVTYDHCANKEVVSDGGIVVPFNDMETMVKETIKLIENPELRAKLGNTANDIVMNRNLPDRWCSAVERTIIESLNWKNVNNLSRPVRKKRSSKFVFFLKIYIIYLKGIVLTHILFLKIKERCLL